MKVGAIILCTLALKCIVAANTELGNDEVYYVHYALFPDWNYFDHPLMVAWCIRLSTLNLFFKEEWFIRLMPIVFSLANMYLVFCIASALKNRTAGYVAALLYNSSIYANVIAGLLILPDTPMTFFWLLSLYFAVKIFMSDYSFIPKKYFYFLGLSVGLCMLSKVHGVLIWGCIGLYVLLFDLKWLKEKYLYFACAISFCFLFPVVKWNVDHDFITFSYHGGRVGEHSFGIHADSFVKELLGNVAYQNPINYVMYVLTLVEVYRGSVELGKKQRGLLLCFSLPVIVLFLLLSLQMDTLPHWSGPGYFALMILSGIYYSERIKAFHFVIPKVVASANALLCATLLTAFLCINYIPVRFGGRSDHELGKGDITLDMVGWAQLGKDFKKLAEYDKLHNRMNGPITIISSYWFPAAHLSFYVAMPNEYSLLAVGDLYNIHQFYFINQKKPALQAGNDAYFITSSNLLEDPHKLYGNLFSLIDGPVRIPCFRGSKIVRYFLVYRCEDAKKQLPEY